MSYVMYHRRPISSNIMSKRSLTALSNVNANKRFISETSAAVEEPAPTNLTTPATPVPAPTLAATPILTLATANDFAGALAGETHDDTAEGNVITAIHTPEASSPTSSPPSPASCIRPPVKTSPTNRDKFIAGLYVQSVGCCLDACTAGPDARLTFKGTVVVLYPMNFNPDRRYVVFMDEDGFTGITIWSPNLKKIATNSIGKLCEITKVNLSYHQGKRHLNLSKESEVSHNELHEILLPINCTGYS